MGDTGFPAQHTTTTILPSNTQVRTSVRCNTQVLRSQDGMIKIAQLVFGLFGVICIEFNRYSIHYSGKFFTTTSLFGICITGILLVLYLFSVVEKYYNIPWKMIELFYCGSIAVFYLACSSLTATVGVTVYKAASFCGFCTMCLYAFDAYSKFKVWWVGEVAQNDLEISKTTSPGPPSPGWNVA